MTFWNRTKSHTFGIARPFYSLWQNCEKHLINCLAAAPTASARYSLTTPYERRDHFLSSPKSCSEHLVNATNCNSLSGRRLASCLMRHFHFVSPKRWIRLCPAAKSLLQIHGFGSLFGRGQPWSSKRAVVQNARSSSVVICCCRELSISSCGKRLEAPKTLSWCGRKAAWTGFWTTATLQIKVYSASARCEPSY